jgi:DNA-binding CsgD family transcriptional regulator
MPDFDGYLSELPVAPQRRRDLGRAEIANLLWISHGLTEAMVADVRHVSRETVKKQLATARGKLAAKNGAHAVAIALRLGLID